MSNEQFLLTKIKRRYLLLRGGETILFGAGIALLSFPAIRFISNSFLVSLIFALGLGLATIIFRLLSLNLPTFTETRIATYLNLHYLQLEASTDLLLSESRNLSSLQKFQREKVYQSLKSLEKDIRFPHQITFAIALFVLAISVWLVMDRFDDSARLAANNSGNPLIESKIIKKQNQTVSLKKIAVTVTPPAYTHRSSRTSSVFSLKTIEGSLVSWVFQFNGNPRDAMLIFSGKDSVRLTLQNGAFAYQRTLHESGFYQFVWNDPDEKIHQSDYYPIELTKDEVPRIKVENLAQFIELKLTDRLVLDLEATLSDDFGIKDSHIIATVTKGSGESVKFREEILRFSSPTSFSGKLMNASRSIDLIALGLEPGDELYFYIEAFDNKVPAANIARTETFFIALQDTSSYEVAEGEGMGVDVLPEYFRSQRQIIIDSEKILEEKKDKKITKESFNAKSNDLGYDQKVLRLRYGQFMGDEEDVHEGDEEEHHEEETVEDMMKGMGHAHDTENENNLVLEKPANANDEASLFQQSIKIKLKTALALMWDAELQLRLNQPDKSLPYQYKILKLLKEISNDSRIYVHRSGFDPPPLKEEKRLGGDLSELKNSFHQNTISKPSSFPAIRKALNTVEQLLQTQNPEVDKASEIILQNAGNELAGVALRQPGRYLQSLSQLKSLLSKELKPEQVRPALLILRNAFWKVVPQERASPGVRINTTHPLDQKFLQQLEAVKHER